MEKLKFYTLIISEIDPLTERITFGAYSSVWLVSKQIRFLDDIYSR